MSNLPSGTVTFLFTDIEGSTKIAQQYRDDWESLRKRHHMILSAAIQAHNGCVFQIVGDAFCAAFHTAADALNATSEAQRNLQNKAWSPVPIKVRMGIHTGTAEVKEDSNSIEYEGYTTLVLTQRIMSVGHGGQILLSQTTYDLVKDQLPENIELRDMGQHHFKNLSHPEHLFQLEIAGLPSDFPPLHTLTHRHNLPVQLNSFIAREQEIALIHKYLLNEDMRLVTLMGPPGIGKTRLSIETARASLNDFPDGVFFVALAPLDDPALIASTMAQALGYVGAKNISTNEQLKEGIGDKHMLIVLDNCEHLIEEAASLSTGLLSACSHLKILASSRESLRIPGEWLYLVPAFKVPGENSPIDLETILNFPALTLFAERARAVQPTFELNSENIKTVSAICAHLDGLPLAIELIAARMRLMSPQALLQRLSSQFILTADGMRAASERQKTLNNAINWSYSLLPPEEQKLFAYLSVFSGGFTLEAVEAMFSQKVTEKPLSTLVASLLDKSLLKLAPDLEASRDARYTMLVTIQEYARERLREIGEETEIRNLHLQYFLNLAAKAGKELGGPNQLEWLNRLDEMRDNFRAALDWAIETGQTATALEMVRSLHWFWLILSNYNEGRQWFHRVLEMPDAPLYPGAYAEVLTQMAHQTFLQITVRDAKPYAEQALSIARTHNDKHNIARALVMLGLAFIGEENFTAAQSAFEESKHLFQEVHDELGSSFAMMAHATLFWQQEDWTSALSLSQHALTGFQKLGHRYFQNVTLRHIGIAYVNLNDLTNGRAALRESLILAQQLNSKYDISQALWRFAEIAQRVNQHVRVVHLFWASRNISDSIGAWQPEDEPWFEDQLAPCRAVLSESEFAEAVELGRAMTMEQAIAYALEDSNE